MAFPTEKPVARAVPEDGTDALSAMATTAGKKVMDYIGTIGGNFVPPIQIANVVAESMNVLKESQEALAAGNEISSLVLSKGKDVFDHKKWAQVIGKHFGIATPWKSVGMSMAADFTANPVVWQDKDGKEQYGRIVSLHTDKPLGLDKSYPRDKASNTVPVAKVQLHHLNVSGLLVPSESHLAIRLDRLQQTPHAVGSIAQFAVSKPPAKPAAGKKPGDDSEPEDSSPEPSKSSSESEPEGSSSSSSPESSSSAPSSLTSSEEAAQQAAVKKEFSLDLDPETAQPVLFAKLSKDDRDRMDPRDFGDPDNRLFPITDQSDVDSAGHLIGKAQDPHKVQHNIKTIAKRKGLKVPDAWHDSKDCATMTAEFSLDSGTAVVTGTRVERLAPVLFRCGNYPDKDFSLTPEEAMAAVADFKSPIDLDLEHKPTVFNGQLGQLTEVSQNPQDPWLLSGKAALPQWLDNLLPDEAKKLSLAFDRRTKKIIGCSLVRTPRVSDAALMAAFAAANPLPLATPPVTTPPAATAPPTTPAPAAPPAAAVTPPVTTPTITPPPAQPVLASGAMDLTRVPGMTDVKLRQIETEAAEFARAEVLAERALPAAQSILEGQYRQAAIDDMALGNKVLFNTGELLSRVETLKREKSLVPPHNLTKEQGQVLPSSQALFNTTQTNPGQAGQPLSEERRKELLSQSMFGREMLNGKAK
jgi:hypothetical protein